MVRILIIPYSLFLKVLFFILSFYLSLDKNKIYNRIYILNVFYVLDMNEEKFSKPTLCRQKCQGFYDKNGGIRGIGSEKTVKIKVVLTRFAPVDLEFEETWTGSQLLDPNNSPIRRVAVEPIKETRDVSVFPESTRIKT